MSTARSTIGTVLLTIGGAILAFLVVAIVVVALALHAVFSPDPGDALVVEDANCATTSETEALVAIHLRADEGFRSLWTYVEDAHLREAELVGVVDTEAAVKLDELTPDALLALRAQARDPDYGFSIDGEDGRVAILVLERSESGTASMNGITFWYSHGEPAYVQTVSVDLEWGSDCLFSLGP